MDRSGRTAGSRARRSAGSILMLPPSPSSKSRIGLSPRSPAIPPCQSKEFADPQASDDCRMATRQQRLDDFAGDGEPPSGEPIELLCEDNSGTYVIPFACHWVDGAWRGMASGRQ